MVSVPPVFCQRLSNYANLCFIYIFTRMHVTELPSVSMEAGSSRHGPVSSRELPAPAALGGLTSTLPRLSPGASDSKPFSLSPQLVCVTFCSKCAHFSSLCSWKCHFPFLSDFLCPSSASLCIIYPGSVRVIILTVFLQRGHISSLFHPPSFIWLPVLSLSPAVSGFVWQLPSYLVLSGAG